MRTRSAWALRVLATFTSLAVITGMTLAGAAPPAAAVGAPMTLTLRTTTPNTVVEMPLNGTVTNITVTWGDGTADTVSIAGNLPHTYAAAGTYHVTISGTLLTHFGVAGNYTGGELTSVESFGDLGLTDLSYAFRGASRLTAVPPTLPPGVTTTRGMFGASTFNQSLAQWDTSHVTDMSEMFANSAAFNQPLSTWDTSHVTDMSEMFAEATVFNQPLGAWDTSNVTDMRHLFYGAAAFNQPLGAWDTSNVTTTRSMFAEATAFNQPLGAWDTSHVTEMSWMFYKATAFNQPLGAWDTSHVTTMSWMFYRATAFNQPLGAWDTSHVTDMSYLFSAASVFNQPLGAWDTSTVTDMRGLFSSTAVFDQPLATWDTSNVTDMGGMFSSTAVFDQPLATWDTSNVTDMRGMFSGADAFNQPLATWNTSNVTDMAYMFSEATAFNQPLGTWNTSNVTHMWDMFTGAEALSAANYSADLIGWSHRKNQPRVRLDAPSTRYTRAAGAARVVLTGAPTNWDIFDAGMIGGTPPSAPRSVTASPRNRSAAIRWHAPAASGSAPITGYIVTTLTRREWGYEAGVVSCHTSGARTCTVKGLRNGNPDEVNIYMFSVRAISAAGNSPASRWSWPIVAGTTTAPRSLTVRFPAARTARLTWSAPRYRGSGPVTGYEVRWSSNNARTWTNWKPTPHIGSMTKTRLIKARRYAVQIRALNNSGRGPVATLRFTQRR